jgi:virginiamycin B lyase
VAFTIAIPAARAAAGKYRTPSYVSPSTQSMSIAINGGAPTNVNLGTGSPNCIGEPATSCTASASAPAGLDTIAVALWDNVGGAGNVLSTKTITQTIYANSTNTIGLTLNAVVSGIALVLGSPSVPAGATTSLPLTVNALDAKNNIIVGPGTYVDANGNPLAINLTATQTTPTVQSPYTAGAATLSASSITTPSSTVMVTYDGGALLSTRIRATVSGTTSVAPTSTTLTLTPTVYEYTTAIPASGPYSLAVGPDKHIWVTLFDASAVEHFAPPGPGTTTLAATSFVMPDTTNQWALGITAGSDGNMWIASWGSEIFVCTLLGICTTISGPSHPEYLVDAGDGNMVLNASYNTGPQRYSITTRSFISDFGIGGGHHLDLGPDGRVWTTGGQQGCCYTPYILAIPTLVSTNSTVTKVSMTADTANTVPGPDGNIWYLQSAIGVVGHLTSLTATAPTGMTIAVPSGPGLRAITAGPDGNMYFTEPAANNIARVLIGATAPNDITEYPVPSANAGLIDLVTGPDGNIWFVENKTSKIGKLAL